MAWPRHTDVDQWCTKFFVAPRYLRASTVDVSALNHALTVIVQDLDGGQPHGCGPFYPIKWNCTHHRRSSYTLSLSTNSSPHLSAVATTYVEFMSQKNQFCQSEASSLGGYKNPNVTLSCQSSAGTPDRSLNNSPWSSSTTLVDDEAQARGLKYGRLHQASVQETVPGVQSMKYDLNANATAFIPSRFVEYGYFPPPAHTPVAWVRILDTGMLAPNIALPTVLAQSGPWSFDTLRDLAQLFCWEILAKANIVDFGPEAAFFVREVRDALRLHHSEWVSSCFVVQLQTAVLEHFKSFWCSLVRLIANLSTDAYSL